MRRWRRWTRKALVRSVGNGEVVVTATAGSVTGTATATVEQVARVVVVTPAEAELSPDDTVRLAADAEDANGFAIADAMLTWSSSDTAVAVVDSTGLVRAVWDGAATITAAVDSVADSTIVAVAREVAVVMLEPVEGELAPGDSVQLAARALDADSVEVGDAVFTWSSSHPEVAVVDSTGLVRAVSHGAATITAAVDSVSDSTIVAVAREVAVVMLEPLEGELAPGDSVQLAARAFDADSVEVGDAMFTWSSSHPGVAVVDSTGLVRAVWDGAATITAAVESVADSMTVTVAREVAVVMLEPVEGELAPGDSVQLAARAFDADSVEVGDAVFTWSSSDTAVAVVDSTGLVRAVSHGELRRSPPRWTRCRGVPGWSWRPESGRSW